MRHLLAACAALAAVLPAAAQDFPKAELKTDGLKLTVYLPDAEKGFYRGTRFDWSGVLGNAEYAGHKLFAFWKDKHDPANFEDALGPVEEFGTDAPLGYTEAKPGETFVKIGVGELVKPKEDKYRFFFNYKIAKPGTWDVKVDGDDRVTFTQNLRAANGYGYRYVKAVSVHPGPELRIAHEFKNTGEKPIASDVYNHNFLNIDADPIGPNYKFRFHYPVAADGPKERFPELVELTGEELAFRKVIDRGSVFSELKGYAADTPAGFTVRHAPSKVKLTVSSLPGTAGAAKLSKYNFWAVKATACPEPFHRLDVKPGEAVSWGWSYKFETE